MTRPSRPQSTVQLDIAISSEGQSDGHSGRIALLPPKHTVMPTTVAAVSSSAVRSTRYTSRVAVSGRARRRRFGARPIIATAVNQALPGSGTFDPNPTPELNDLP